MLNVQRVLEPIEQQLKELDEYASQVGLEGLRVVCEPTGNFDRKVFETAEGTLEIQKPRVWDAREPFESRILVHLDGMEERLKKMVVEMYVRGLSTRDIEETLVDQDGEPLVSRSTVRHLSSLN